MPFDPDAYLAAKPAFDPDAYLASGGAPGAMPAPPISGAPDLNWQDPGYQEAITPKPQSYTGSVLPFSIDEGGEMAFDPNAGILGGAKRTVTLPGEVLKGEIDPLSEEGQQRTLEAATFMTPMGAATRVPGSVFAPKYKSVTPKAPTRESLKKATDAGYQEARDMGAAYTPSSVKSWAGDTVAALDKEWRIAENYPKVHAILTRLRNPAKDAEAFTLGEMDAVYKELGTLGADKAEGQVASLVQKSLDDFHGALDESQLVAGTATPQKAAEVLREARGNAAAGFRSDRVTDLERTAARRTAAANSGKNVDNATRQRLTSLIESAKGSRGLSKQEEQAIDDIIFGKPTKNAARYVGNLLGGGGGMISALLGASAGAGGFATMGPAGLALAAVPPAIGAVSRGIANKMTKNELKALDDLIRSRSPQSAAQGTKQVPVSTAAREAMLKALLSQTPKQQEPSDIYNALGA